MLTRLAIRNIVLIDALDLAFPGGLGVLTGETGAGKSILLDALGLVLGNRAESGLLRAGEERASVTATFEFGELPQAVREVLAEADVEIEPGEPLILRRTLKSDGASKAFVNDQPVGAALLRELAPALVELHGQQERDREGTCDETRDVEQSIEILFTPCAADEMKNDDERRHDDHRDR